MKRTLAILTLSLAPIAGLGIAAGPASASVSVFKVAAMSRAALKDSCTSGRFESSSRVYSCQVGGGSDSAEIQCTTLNGKTACYAIVNKPA